MNSDDILKKIKEMYKISTNYFNKYGNLKIIQRFKTIDGINYDEEGYTLGIWIINQRRMYKKVRLPQNRIRMLEKIGMVWSIIDRVGKKEKYRKIQRKKEREVGGLYGIFRNSKRSLYT